ncbi:putative olfactory receptor 14L1 [Ornithorhynchus anatinus]|uniref:putative olfactory receptor 14L1 n=1 Tax=Ornithorhynchus anatinus TaxID=9258 RepID=UPI0010A7B8C1|nr:putative olfactory receptor 14L1 [Ornithorhynchus anatinus]
MIFKDKTIRFTCNLVQSSRSSKCFYFSKRLEKGAHSFSVEGMSNISTVMEFLLLGFSGIWKLQLVHAALFLLVSLAALTGNLLIVTVTALDLHLHTPMYFFVSYLALIDLCFICVTIPKSVINSLTNNRSIRARGKMAAASWLSGGLSGLTHMAATFSKPFCGSNVIQHFFCDAPHLLGHANSSVILREAEVTTFTTGLSLLCFISTIVSYVHIFSVVLTMPSVEGRSKAFSTCLPQLVVVTLFLSTGAFAFLNLKSNGPSGMDLFLSMFYSIVPPAMNPIIYSLRNRELKASLGRMLYGTGSNKGEMFAHPLVL